ncbi:hypothetical protein BVRB_008000 [Beta vulgaris subsp. vulgaris]|uniref:Uncharacterized protein n=1 Tax=Beta vulgaris subsp. vulgaris TaxID=3555 RepID=A0A0J8B387_BETVV|nr:hypothetical protein BVRB_008000 [Beta vulgaris subsp. vulgaris]
MMAVNKPSTLMMISMLFMLLFSAVHSSSFSDFDIDFDTVVSQLMDPSTTSCDGSIGECSQGGDLEEEFLVDSESNRRILASRRYISYGALNRNRVPCSRRGASYYNCRPGGSANPYRRGCSRISRCRR